MHQELQESISQRLQLPEQQTANSVEEHWTRIKEATYEAPSETLGFATSKHKEWFDDQDTEAQGLLDVMHSTHLAWMRDKNCLVKKMAYTQARQKAQLRLREMKNQWWNNKAAELQAAADRHDTKTFFHGLKAAYGPREAGSAPVKSLHAVTLTDRTKILERWKVLFETVLNQSSSFDVNVLSEIPQWPLASRLDEVPTRAEIQKAINQISNGKAPGTDGRSL